MLASSVVVLAGFVVFERRRESLGKDPLMVSALFRNRSFTVGMLLYIACFSGLPSLFLTLSLFLQIGLGYTPLHAGLTTIPFAVGSGLASGMSIRLVPRLGRTLLIAGAGLAAVGVLGVILTIRVIGPGLNGPELIPALFVAGAGLGSLLAPSLNFVLSGTENIHVGSASGVLTTVQQIGGAIGIAIIGVIYFGLLGANADRVSHGLLPQLRQQLEAQAVPQYISERVLSGFTTCFHDRASESDPTVVPASCQSPQSPQSPAAPVRAPGLAARLAQIKQAIGGAVGNVAREARAQDFTDSIQGSLLYNAGAFALTFLVLFWLPRPTVSGAGRNELSADC
jgi:hypothetical protein